MIYSVQQTATSDTHIHLWSTYLPFYPPGETTENLRPWGNPCGTEFISENLKIHLHFLLFLTIAMVQFVEFVPKEVNDMHTLYIQHHVWWWTRKARSQGITTYGIDLISPLNSDFNIKRVNSLWFSDAIWRQRSGSTLAQVMACCLTAPSHYLNQFWLIISKVCGIHRKALSWEDLKIPISNTRLKITF